MTYDISTVPLSRGRAYVEPVPAPKRNRLIGRARSPSVGCSALWDTGSRRCISHVRRVSANRLTLRPLWAQVVSDRHGWAKVGAFVAAAVIAKSRVLTPAIGTRMLNYD